MPKPMMVTGWLLAGLFLAGRAGAVDLDLARYATAKENQVRDYALALTNPVPDIVWRFFDAVKADDWETATNLAGRINQASGRYADGTEDAKISPALRTVIWPPISEMVGTYEQFHNWDNKWLHRFGREVMGSIPRDSIYFGGTDPGRFIISALEETAAPENRFFILTQNQLVDESYLENIHELYDPKINLPTPQDAQKAFQDYVTDAQARLQNGGLRPGEQFQMINGQAKVSGLVAVMTINGLLARTIFDRNPGHEFFVEESYPIEWMFPYLSPHGLILQLHAKPLEELSETEVRQDQEYWRKFTGELIGDWLTEQTRMKELCDFAGRVYLDKNLAGFKGDAGFAKNDPAQKCFAKLRSAQAGVYAWRAAQAADMNEKIRMQKAADRAFAQAFALCPYSPETVFRYTDLLLAVHRPDDAFLMVKTALLLDPDNLQLKQLIEAVRKAQ